MKPAEAIIAIGSNLGNARENVSRAIARLQAFSDSPIASSSLWLTTPVDCPPGSPDFVNAIVIIQPRAGETPESLLPKLQALEIEFGRKRKTVLNEARVLDLDIIAFGEETRHSPELTLPHPRAAQRRFVLEPLSELRPELKLPGQCRTVAELLAALPPEPAMRRLGGHDTAPSRNTSAPLGSSNG